MPNEVNSEIAIIHTTKRLATDQGEISVAKITKIQNPEKDILARKELDISIIKLYKLPCSDDMTLFYLCTIRINIIYFLSTARLIGKVSIYASKLVRSFICAGLRYELVQSILYSETLQRVFSIVKAALAFRNRQLIWTTRTRMMRDFS
jgi:hypothetical protein